MDKNNRLINIYIKIHNKRTITMEDLQYLAKYDPECFRKTCANVVYNMPETKSVMSVSPAEASAASEDVGGEVTDEFDVMAVLNRLNELETNSDIYGDISAKRVKNLLGNLFMELLFPHNDEETFIGAVEEEKTPSFDMKA